ncbi:Rv3235 family protein [Paenarthrobacter sp. CCNWLY172]|uniref:Rv3235 family protein n=1 Tax=Paenarthrobacter sp. AMU7 TaxID=3162492 RepID=A0AB39YM95_9MICC|nr:MULTISPECIES: Rv3235 family protein [Micrococcaceae]WGM19082.1 Rv3235 family protein [Paenarthrobacter sp. OM7]
MTVATASRPAGRQSTQRTLSGYGSSGSDIDVRLVARSIAQAALEVLAGTRAVSQLSRSLDPDCYVALQHRAALTRKHAARVRGNLQPHRSPMVRSVRACSISEDICEASIVVAEELRCRAVAMRLERLDGVWRVTALEIG